jgi:hypothetical protein
MTLGLEGSASGEQSRSFDFAALEQPARVAEILLEGTGPPRLSASV